MLSIYKASAGSGKTYTLAGEYIRLLLSAPDDGEQVHSHILAVTFTKKATAEMKERILQQLYILAKNPADSPYSRDLEKTLSLSQDAIQQRAQSRLYQLLQDYSRFAISTIDGFFQQVVRSFARELGLPATYNLTLDGQEVINHAVDDILFALSRSTREEDGWLTEFALQNIHEGKGWNPKNAIQDISTYLLTERLQTQLVEIHSLLADKEFLRTYKGKLKQIIDRGESEWYKKQERRLSPEILERKRDFYTAKMILENLNALGLLSDVSAQIARTNREQNRLPISDINLLLHQIIDGSDSPFIYEKIGNWIRHYMIDEFQDTSSLQWENFRPLVNESNANGNDNLIVGDIKQSIYRWRNSDWHLLEQVHQQITPNQQPKMNINFRSSHIIVNANNEIFRSYCGYVANLLENDKDVCSIDYADSVRSAYSTLEQEAKKTNLDGHFEIDFIDKDQVEDTTSEILDRVLSIIRNIESRKIPLNHVAILIRKAREAQQVTQFLVENGLQVQSAEGLLVAAHPAVEVLVCLLSLSIHPNDEILQNRLRLVIAKHKNATDEQQAIQWMLSDEPIFTEAETQIIQHAHTLPFYEQVQYLVDNLKLYEWNNATAYVTSFLDIVFQYSESQIADVGTFLQYWERKQDSASIPASTTNEAIQIMTIHKSKGLEFDYVIVPFLTWPVAAGKMDSEKLLWCKPTIQPFAQLLLVPIKFNKSNLPKTHFQQAYAAELRDLYIDNLNLTYVAFTRPKYGLYAFAELATKTTKGEDSIRNVGNLLSVVLRDEIKDGSYIRTSLSEEGSMPSSQEDHQDIIYQDAEYLTEPIGKRLKLRTHSRADEDLSLQDFGTLMHDLLAEIQVKEDTEQAIRQSLYLGRAREEDTERIHAELDKFWHLLERHHHEDWFTHRYEILCEQDIMTPTGDAYRPDRVMIDGEQAIVIDYKFGHERKSAYHEQVRNYMTILSQMGYQTSGYLIYVNLELIETV